ncbi:MAG: iron uptake porin [Vampirovibrionales bacterium]
MALKRVTPALLAAFLAVAGLTSGIVAGFQSAEAITSVDELTDVDPNHWGYEALKNLVEKYDVIEGYPSHVFKGQKFATRWEMAAALYALIQTIGKDIARLDAEKLDKADLETIQKLTDEFGSELAALKGRTTRLEERVDAADAKNAEQDSRLDLLEKTRIHGDMTFGVLYNAGEAGARGRTGIEDGISPVARLRLGLDIPVVEATGEVLGEGTLRTRLVAAVGRRTTNFNGVSRFGADASANNEALGTSANLRQNLYAEYAYYEQNIAKIIPNQSDDYKTTATVFAGIIPHYRLYDRSEYRGVDDITSFQNVAFNNIPGLPVNFTGAGAALRVKQNLSTYGNLELTAGLSSSDSNQWLNYQAATYELRYNHNWFDRTGSVYAGGFHLYSLSNRNVSAVNVSGLNIIPGTSNGFFAGINQELYKGIGLNVAGFLGDKSGNAAVLNAANQLYSTANTAITAQHALTTALVVPMSVFGVREQDKFGLGYAYTAFNSFGTGFTKDGAEHSTEVFYTAAINEKVSVTPSVQFHMNRFGQTDNGFSTSVGLRTNIKF